MIDYLFASLFGLLLLTTCYLAYVAHAPYDDCRERADLFPREFVLRGFMSKQDYCWATAGPTFPPTFASPWSDWAAAGIVPCVLGSIFFMALIGTRDARNKRAAFAARVGLSIDDPLIARAYTDLSSAGRAQINSLADLTRLLRDRTRYNAQLAAKATRKDRERARRELFF
jgi:hypothetical protein